MSQNIRQVYQERFDKFDAKAQKLKRQSSTLSIVRLVYFLVGVAVAIYLFNTYGPRGGFSFLLVFFTLFLMLVRWHDKMTKERDYYLNLSRINELELAALDHDFSNFEDGEAFEVIDHPYLGDLDVFGPRSIYQYFNRTGTAKGRRTLSNWLKQPSHKAEIELRQTAVAELKDKVHWRQHLQATGLNMEDTEADIEAILHWMQTPFFIINNTILKGIVFILPIAMLLAIALYLLGIVHGGIPVIVWLLNLGVIKYTEQEVTQTVNQTAKKSDLIRVYQQLFEHIEQGGFTSPKMQSLQQILSNSGTPNSANAAKAIARFGALSANLNVRSNVFAYLIFNTGFLWELLFCKQLEDWRKNTRTKLSEWLEVLGEVEALSSFACAYCNNSKWILPNIHPQFFKLQAVQTGHPLLNPSTRICNDITLDSSEKIMLITGSNMAGKSTFLRTVGINIILANAGAPVCAQSFTTSEVMVHSSMRNKDSLQDSESSFFAELKGLKSIIDVVEKAQPPVFFLLDEILKGTNSKDRHQGSVALIKQLLRHNGVGIIATHDLALCELSPDSDGHIENWCFEVAINQDNMVFDYTIKPGVCQSMNATLLMKKMGIDM